MPFTTSTTVRFAHVDAAGIVFYPRYFEMVNAAVEDWFAQELGLDFATMHLTRQLGVPTVKLDVEFKKPSRLGDTLVITITPVRLGYSSCAIRIDFTCEGENCLSTDIVLVCMDLTSHRATSWPDEVRAKLEEGLVSA